MSVDVTASVRPLVAQILSEGRVEAAYSDLILSLLDHTAMEGGGQRAITLLPALTCEAHGGDPKQAAPACAAWLLLRLAAKLLDDVEDRDLDAGQSLHVNAAAGLLELAHLCVDALAREGVPRPRVARIGAELSRAILRAAGGQHRDLIVERDAVSLDPDGWLAIAILKSGIPLGWAAWAGAAIAGARGSRLEGYRRYGECLGVLLQIADDYNDVWAPGVDANVGPDVVPSDAPNLAIAYARLVADEAARRRLDRALRAARRGDADALTEVREALIDLGAQMFVLAAGRTQYRLAAEALGSAGARPAIERQLVALLDGVMPALRIVSDP
jgi:geranylgeranyl pyrophosphate synthase